MVDDVSDPYIILKAGKKSYKILKSQRNRLVALTADYILKQIKQEKSQLSDERYLSLLYDYTQWINEEV